MAVLKTPQQKVTQTIDAVQWAISGDDVEAAAETRRRARQCGPDAVAFLNFVMRTDKFASAAQRVRAASTLQSPFLLLVRLYWGIQLAQNGWGKLHNLGRVTEFFSSLGLPAPGATATFVATVEFIGGILLAIGLLSRFMGLVITIDMLMAYIMADREAFFSFISDPGMFYVADP